RGEPPATWARRMLPISGAQRLSASRRGEPRVDVIFRGLDGVLNACRHQGGGNPPAGPPARAGWRVLNACRHQGEGNPVFVYEHFDCFTCSTPVGIKARGTPSGVPRERRRGECSTPVGIKARGTPRAVVAGHDAPVVL